MAAISSAAAASPPGRDHQAPPETCRCCQAYPAATAIPASSTYPAVSADLASRQARPGFIPAASPPTAPPSQRPSVITDDGRSRAPKELASTMDTEAIIAIIAHTGASRPVTASGTPMPLTDRATARFCLVVRNEP